jgi:protease IV
MPANDQPPDEAAAVSASPTIESTARSDAAAAAQVQPAKQHTALWILLAVTVGFLLPVCACSMLLAAGLIGAGTLGLQDVSMNSALGESVALVRVDGVIMSGTADEFTPGSATSGVIISDLETAANDPLVKAVVLHVDSPGGTVTGSAQIHEVLAEFQKPIVVSMESLAASGGYYVSAPADYIFARPDTWTGSIGVIAQFINAEGLMEELGIEATTIASGKNKAFGGLFHDLTPEQEAIMQTLVEESFNDFVQVIVDGRGLSREEVLALADGRIYSGRQALDNGLVDELGNLDDAIAKAAELGGISGEPYVIEYEHLPNFTQLLLGFSGMLRQGETGRIKAELDRLSTPKLEYRYVGTP